MNFVDIALSCLLPFTILIEKSETTLVLLINPFSLHLWEVLQLWFLKL